MGGNQGKLDRQDYSRQDLSRASSKSTYDTRTLKPIFGNDAATSEHLPVLNPIDFDLPADFSFPSDHNPVEASFNLHDEGWTIDFEIGRGGFGRTYLATHQITGRRYVVKFLLHDDDPEYLFLKTVPTNIFRHKNLLTVIAVAEGIKNVFKGGVRQVWGYSSDCPQKLPNVIVFMEAYANGELLNFLISTAVTDGMAKPKHVKDGTMRHFVADIIRGMSMLCRHGISHRDLKPDNLLMDEHGRVVIIDLGKARRYEKATVCLSPPSPSRRILGTSQKKLSEFFAEQTGLMGTRGYHAPEVSEHRYYDSELADVFSVGIIIFQMKKATMASWIHQEYDAECLTDGGLNPKMYGLAGHFSEELIALCQSMLSRNPERRPRFEDLEAACDGDEDVIARLPHLRWLAGEFADPMTFIKELVAHKPNIRMKMPGLIEAFIEWKRLFNDQGAAFAAANASNSGYLTTEELYCAMERAFPGKFAKDQEKYGPEGHQKGLAKLLLKYTGGKSVLTLEMFQRMCDDWSFGGRKIVPITGKQRSRFFAFLPRVGQSASEAESMLFTEYFQNTCTSCGFKVVPNKEAGELITKETNVRHVVFSANMQIVGIKGKPEDLCRLRFDSFCKEGIFIMASKKVWGSVAEEMYMLRRINDIMARQWGTRTDAPKVWDD